MGKKTVWDIYWADVAYEDNPEIIKKRPVVIKSDGGAFIMSFYATSQPSKPEYDCYPIKQWREAGLDKPTVVRLDKCLRLEPNDFHEYIGHLTEQDALILQLELMRVINR